MRKLGIAFAVLMLGRLAFGQANPWYQTDFPPEEFQARWAKIFDKIGLNAVAVLQGVPQTNWVSTPAPPSSGGHRSEPCFSRIQRH